MNIDEAISRLESIRDEHGPWVEIWTTDDTGAVGEATEVVTAEYIGADGPYRQAEFR